MRTLEPQLARAYRMPLYPLPALLGLVTNVALLAALFYEDPAHSSIGVALVAVIAVFSAGRVRRVHRSASARVEN